MPKGGRGSLALGNGSARDVLIATAVAGAAGYAITVAAGASLGNEAYLPFAAFWSALYLVVGALAGIQHETTRAARPAPSGTHPGTSARSIVLVTAAATAALLAAPSPWWVPAVFDSHGWALLLPLIVGALGYIVMAVAGGVLAGLASWRLVALITMADALARAALFAVGIALGGGVVMLAWCVAVPFGLIGLAAAAVITPTVRGSYVIAEPLRAIAWNAARTVASGAAMGVLIAGFPAMLKATTSASDFDASSVVFVSSLVRSPLIVLAMAFQVMLVQRLRDNARPLAFVGRSLAALAVTGGALTGAVALVGPWLLGVVFGGEYQLSAGAMAMLVASAVPAAALFVSGAALLASNGHGTYVAGWAAAAGVALVSLVVFRDHLLLAVGVATVVAPTIGLGVHLIAIVRRAARRIGPAPEATAGDEMPSTGA